MLYYTGAIQHLAQQTDPSKSLGGYISSSQVPNDVLGNLFPTIDYSTLINKTKHIRVVAFLNTTGGIINNFSIYTNTPPDSFSKLKVGLILNEIDESCNIPYFETLPNGFSTPLYIQLYDAEGPGNAITLNSIPNNQYVGVFLQREIIVENNEEFNPDGTLRTKTCEDFYLEYKQNPEGNNEQVVKKDEIELVILIDEN